MKQGESKFSTEYGRLNTAQKEAVDTIEGPVMVVAGPGTGKTQILTLRVANILRKTDVPPDAILALTFTDNAAGEMRKRLVEIVGPSAYRVNVYTFHGFANDIIGRFPNYFPRLVGATNIGEVERAALLEEIFTNSKLDKLRPYGDPFFYLAPTRRRISDLKRDGISPDEYLSRVNSEEEGILNAEDLYHDKGAHKGKRKGKYSDALERVVRVREFARVYARYEELLAKRRLYDYDDMILEVVRTMEASEDFRLRLSEEYQYILADEHQDANGAQNKLLELLASFFGEPNLFLVGDEKQAIFRFQGASLENFHGFKKRYPNSKVIVLTDNYRSGQGILDVAHALIPGAPLTAQSETITARTHVKVAGFKRREYELIWLAGQDLTDAAILVRDNRDAELVARTLGKCKVPYVLETDDDLLENAYVRELVALLRAVHHLGRDDEVVGALHAPSLGLDPLLVYKLVHKASKERVPLYELIRTEREFAHVYKLLASWKSYEHIRGVLALIEKVCEESGLLARALGDNDPESSLLALSNLLDYARTAAGRVGKVDLAMLLRHIELSDRYNIRHKNKHPDRAGEGVRIMTAHKSKGLEWAKVYIVFAEDGRWGGRRAKETLLLPSERSGEALDDERRLFYVALTRGKREVTISFSRRDGERDALPTQFLSEIDPKLLTDATPGVQPNEALVAETSLRQEPEPTFALSDKEFVVERFAEQGLSVSALNNYLECPWKYFYQSLLRIPRTPDKFAMFGTAVHEALRVLNESAREGELINEREFVASFIVSMKKMPLPESDIKESVKKGEKALIAYYKHYKQGWSKDILSEFDIKGVHLNIPDSEPVLLRGRIDKIELLKNGGVHVVDYKSGKPKSRNELMGKTYKSLGNEYRQLLFYKILLDRYKDGKYKVATGEIDFIEPTQAGKHKSEKFEIMDTEVTELTQKIAEVATEIRVLAFWSRKCPTKDCEYCALRNMMSGDGSK